jgi:RsiW-degrading membrane proteinase PrsW (M82 family)
MLFILSLQVIIPIIVLIIAGCFVPFISIIRQADPTLFWIVFILVITGLALLLIVRFSLSKKQKKNEEGRFG